LPIPSDDEPLELDDRRSSQPPPLPQRGFTPGSPPRAKAPPAFKPQEGKGKPPPPPREALEVDLDPDMPAPDAEPDELPDDAILTPSAEDLVSSPDDDAITIEDAAPARSPQRPPPRGPAGVVSIADLLASESEEEVELLSISSDEEAAGERSTANEASDEASDEADFDAAFGTIAPRSGTRRKKVPAKKVPLFDDLSQEAFIELVNKLAYHRHVAGQLIIREGDPGRSFYVIVEGKVRVHKTGADGKEITLAHLGEGAFFGEMALLSGAPRTANVVAEEDTEILEVTDVVLRELAGKHPQVVSSLKNFYRQRLLNNVMAISPLFVDFDPGERKQIVEKFRMKQAAPGEVLITEGTNSDGLYVVLHGGVQVAKSKNKRPIELAMLKEGDIFGEMSLLTRKPATATVTSQGNAILLRLPRENFQELVLTHPQILALVSELTEKRKSATEAILQGQGAGHDGMSFL
jgi:CRP-like cAMP-binding protein